MPRPEFKVFGWSQGNLVGHKTKKWVDLMFNVAYPYFFELAIHRLASLVK
jgi:hypothetical protein